MTEIHIVAACRTPIGAFGGALKSVSAVELGVVAAKGALERSGVQPEQINEVLFGCVLVAGLGQNVARQVSLHAGIPATVPAATVNMVCGSGMKVVIEAARAIASGDAQLLLVGGTENMSRSVFLTESVRWGTRMGNFSMVDSMLRDGLTDTFNDYHMGITAENVADQWGISREDMDDLALASQIKVAAAITTGRFRDEIVPVTVKSKQHDIIFDTDEFPRETTIDVLAGLRPAFKTDGRVTAGNASGINDGAAALVMASGEAVEALGLKSMAKLVGWGQAGVEPEIMGAAPIDASRAALAKAGLMITDIDLVEANEAFAAQALAVGRELGFDWSKVNVNGGAIALGHPIGASGTRIIVTLLHEMIKRGDVRTGLATLCIGGGMGIATIFEKVS